MPELPEVQTVVNDLSETITGDQITGFWTNLKKSITLKIGEAKLNSKDLVKIVTGLEIVKVERIGKYIVLTMTKGFSLLLHLRMTGKLIVENKKNQTQLQQNKHVHNIFFLKKNGALTFDDVRKFGTIDLINTSERENFKGIAKLGADPFSKKFTLEYLAKNISQKKKSILKEFLLNQEIISGIGNIYASEILFDAKIDPNRKAGSLSKKETFFLHASIKKILHKAIQMRGTSISDYRDASGKKGSFQTVLNVYKRNGQPCKKCATIILKTIHGQRSTFYCPKCQK